MNRRTCAAVLALMVAGISSGCATETPPQSAAALTSRVVLTQVVTKTVETQTVESTTEATTEEETEPVDVTTTAAEDREVEVPAESASAIMPDVKCMNLQDAQNSIQDAGVFFSRSEDASGKGRKQVMDSNWVVVSQSPAAGTRIGEGEAVLSVVKIGESSPC